MTILYIVLGVLFLITWIVIAASSTDTDNDIKTYSECNHGSMRYLEEQNLVMLKEISDLRRRNRFLEDNRYCCTRPGCHIVTALDYASLKETLKELPTELTINDKTYKKQ